jgi:hypothetical protein
MNRCIRCNTDFDGSDCPKCKPSVDEVMSCAHCSYSTLKSYAPNFCPNCGKQYALEPGMIDITTPKLVQIVVRHDKKVAWVNVDGDCVLRCCRVEKLELIMEPS